MLGIRIRRIRLFLGLPDPDPLVRGANPDPALDPAPDPSLSHKCLERTDLILEKTEF